MKITNWNFYWYLSNWANETQNKRHSQMLNPFTWLDRNIETDSFNPIRVEFMYIFPFIKFL